MKNRYLGLASYIIFIALLFPPQARADESQLFSLIQQLQKQMAEMQKTVHEQNDKILLLEKRVPQIQMAPSPTAETAGIAAKKPKSLGENFRHSIVEKPESLPQQTEKHPLLVGMGDVELGILLQEWYTIKDSQAKTNFRHRRLELGLGGRLADHLKWKLVFDPSEVREDNTQRSDLKDAYLAFDGISHHEIKLGQYKIPITEEGYRSSSLIDTLERSFLGRTWGDKRDIGLMGSGKWKYLDYDIGVFNGDERNRFDTNNAKDLAARFVLKPFPDHPALKGLRTGTSLYLRTSNQASEKKRIGVDAQYEVGPLSLKTEYMKAQDSAVPGYGWYGQAGYYFLPRWQGLARFEGFDPNERLSQDREYDMTLGLNYYLVANKTKLQLNYVHKDGQNNVADNDQIITGMQYAF